MQHTPADNCDSCGSSNAAITIVDGWRPPTWAKRSGGDLYMSQLAYRGRTPLGHLLR